MEAHGSTWKDMRKEEEEEGRNGRTDDGDRCYDVSNDYLAFCLVVCVLYVLLSVWFFRSVFLFNLARVGFKVSTACWRYFSNVSPSWLFLAALQAYARQEPQV